MLGWALTFLIVALVAAILGFGGIAGAAVSIAKIIFFVAIVLFAISADRASGPRQALTAPSARARQRRGDGAGRVDDRPRGSPPSAPARFPRGTAR